MHEIVMQTWDDIEAREGRRVLASTTIVFGLDGEWHEIDLTAENGQSLRAALAPWLEASRRADSSTVKAPPRPPGTRKYPGLTLRSWEHGRAYGEAIRQFAREHGYDYVTPGSREAGTGGKYYYSRELRDAYARSIGRE